MSLNGERVTISFDVNKLSYDALFLFGFGYTEHFELDVNTMLGKVSTYFLLNVWISQGDKEVYARELKFYVN
jgi:hypothetical protein